MTVMPHKPPWVHTHLRRRSGVAGANLDLQTEKTASVRGGARVATARGHNAVLFLRDTATHSRTVPPNSRQQGLAARRGRAERQGHQRTGPSISTTKLNQSTSPSSGSGKTYQQSSFASSSRSSLMCCGARHSTHTGHMAYRRCYRRAGEWRSMQSVRTAALTANTTRSGPPDMLAGMESAQGPAHHVNTHRLHAGQRGVGQNTQLERSTGGRTPTCG